MRAEGSEHLRALGGFQVYQHPLCPRKLLVHSCWDVGWKRVGRGDRREIGICKSPTTKQASQVMGQRNTRD